MLEIYFDGILIDQEYYKSLTNNCTMFTDQFKLGTTAANSFGISVPIAAFPSVPEEITIKLDGEEYATTVLDSFTIENDKFYNLVLTDGITSFNFEYDASAIVPCTTLDIVKDMCSKIGVELATEDFINNDVEVDFWDNRIKAKQYLSFISEIAAGYAQKGRDGKLYIKKFTDRPIYYVDMNVCENFKIKEHRTVERVVFDNGILKFQTSEDENLDTLYLNPENVYITSETVFNNIASEIIGFDYYNFETGRCEINPDVMAGDKLIFTDGTNEYNSIAQYSLNFSGQWIGGYSLSLSSRKQTETQQTGVNTQVKNIRVDLNRIDNMLDIAIEEIDENTTDIANLNLTTEAIKLLVESAMDFRGEATGQNAIFINDAAQTDMASFKLHQLTDSFEGGLYPSNVLYPSPDLYPRGNSFLEQQRRIQIYVDINPPTNPSRLRRSVTYDIAEPLRRVGNVYDEFFMGKRLNEETNLNEMVAQITRRVSKSGIPLQEEIIEVHEYQPLTLFDGKNYIYTRYYDSARMEIVYATNSELNEWFATNVELQSQFLITKESINLAVSKKVGYDEIISRINQTAEEIQIDANKISLEGKEINLTSDNIVINSNNFNVDEQGNATMNSANVLGGKISLTSNDTEASLKITNTISPEKSTDLTGRYLRLWNGNVATIQLDNSTGTGIIHVGNEDGTSHSVMNAYYVESPEFRNSSLEEIKKNIKKYKNGLSVIKSSDIYTYNLKNESDQSKKRIGLVIGDKYNTPPDVLANEGKAIDIYAMIGVAWNAIKEQQKEIENLKAQIESFNMKGAE